MGPTRRPSPAREERPPETRASLPFLRTSVSLLPQGLCTSRSRRLELPAPGGHTPALPNGRVSGPSVPRGRSGTRCTPICVVGRLVLSHDARTPGPPRAPRGPPAGPDDRAAQRRSGAPAASGADSGPGPRRPPGARGIAPPGRGPPPAAQARPRCRCRPRRAPQAAGPPAPERAAAAAPRPRPAHPPAPPCPPRPSNNLCGPSAPALRVPGAACQSGSAAARKPGPGAGTFRLRGRPPPRAPDAHPGRAGLAGARGASRQKRGGRSPSPSLGNKRRRPRPWVGSNHQPFG